MPKSATFNIHKIAAAFPEAAATMLIDTRLTDEPEASAPRLPRLHADATALSRHLR